MNADKVKRYREKCPHYMDKYSSIQSLIGLLRFEGRADGNLGDLKYFGPMNYKGINVQVLKIEIQK